MAEPFFWGAGGQKITSPAQAAKQREIAEALMGRSSKPAQNWAEGLSHLAGAWSGTQLQNQAAAAEEEGQRAVAEILAGLSPQSSFEDIAAVYSNPWASQGQSAVAQALLGQNMQQNDPMYQMQQEKLRLELEALNAPPAPAQPEYVWEGDRWWEKPVDGSAPISASAAPGPEYDFMWGPNGDLIRTDAASGGIDALGNYAAPNSADAPKTTTIFDPGTGRDQVVQWDAMSGSWIPVGGVAAAPQASPTGGMQEYDAYAADEMAAGRIPLGRLEYEQAIRSSGATRINVGDNGQNFPAPPFGQDYRRHPDGTVIVGTNGMPEIIQIPGGPQSIEAEAAALEAYAAAADAAAQQAAAANQQDIATSIITTAANGARAAYNSGAITGGILGNTLAMDPASQAAELRRQVDVLKSKASISNLQAMRAASPTGGALGSVSDRENKMLADASGALDPSSPNFPQQLDNYERILLEIVHGAEAGRQIYEQTRQPAETGAIDYNSPEPPPSWGGDPSLWRFLSPEDRALW